MTHQQNSRFSPNPFYFSKFLQIFCSFYVDTIVITALLCPVIQMIIISKLELERWLLTFTSTQQNKIILGKSPQKPADML